VLLVLALTATLFTSDTDTTFTVQRGQRLELNTHAGDIVVHTWARNAVRVQTSGSSRFHVAIDQTASLVSIHSAGGRSGPPNLDYQLTVPTWMAIRLSGVTADMRVDGVQGPVNAETVEGDVVVVGGDGLVSLRSVQGDVSLTDAKGKIDVNSVNSDVNVRNISGELQAETVNGDVNLIQVQSDNVEANTVNGDVNYDGTIRANGRYRLTTHNGEVTVVIPEGTGAQVSVSTFQGDFESAFPVTLTERHGRRFDFTIGNGSARIELESFGGTIRLVRPGGLHIQEEEGKEKHREHDE
jgi:DUF4097 and DUF4098 domain-containing protein YvlB